MIWACCVVALIQEGYTVDADNCAERRPGVEVITCYHCRQEWRHVKTARGGSWAEHPRETSCGHHTTRPVRIDTREAAHIECLACGAVRPLFSQTWELPDSPKAV